MTPAAPSGSLFAYGGTRFAPRRQVGAWSAELISAAADPGGLSADTICCGLGTAERRPLLFFRNLQKPEERGGYPYSIFLRFSDEFWKAVDFNPHHLLGSILSSGPLLEKLLHAPESLDLGRLETDLIGLAREAGPASDRADDVPDSLALLVQAAFQAGCRTCAIPFSVEGAVPFISGWASTASRFPRALRQSLTWSYGNSPRLATLVQARLHLVPGDKRPATGKAGLDAEPVAEGRALMAALETLRENPAGRGVWTLLDATPLSEWNSVHHQDVAELKARLLLLGESLHAGSSPRASPIPLQELSDQRPLASELRGLYQERLGRKLRQGHELDRDQTLQILRTFSAAGERLEPAIAGKIDPELAAREFIRLDLRPAEVLDNPAVSRSYYLRALRLAPDPIDVEFLREAAATADPEIVREAIVQTEPYPEIWIEGLRGLDEPSRVLKELESRTREKIRRAPNIKNSVAYVLFGNDPGGAWLSRQGDLGFRLQLIRELVKLRRKEYTQLRFSGEVLERIDDWLDRLRPSPLGRDLPLDLMAAVAKVAGGSWRPFLKILSGGDLEGILAAENDPAERERLLEDYNRHLTARRRRPAAEATGSEAARSGRQATRLDIRASLERYTKKQLTSEQVVRSGLPAVATDGDEERIRAFLRKPEIRAALAHILADYAQPVTYYRQFFSYVLSRLAATDRVEVVAEAGRRAPRPVSRAIADELSLLRFPQRKGIMEQLSGIWTQTRGKASRDSLIPEPLQSYCRYLVTAEGRKFRSVHLARLDFKAAASLEKLLKSFEE